MSEISLYLHFKRWKKNDKKLYTRLSFTKLSPNRKEIFPNAPNGKFNLTLENLASMLLCICDSRLPFDLLDRKPLDSNATDN